MAFADFQLKSAVKSFDLSEDRRTDLFRDVAPIEPSEHLRGWLAEFAPVAPGINTEELFIDVREYYLHEVEKLVGILVHIARD